MNVRREIRDCERELVSVEAQIELYEYVFGRDECSTKALKRVEDLKSKLEGLKRTQEVFDRIDERLASCSYGVAEC